MPAKLIYSHSECPEVSVIIPSWDGVRGGNVDRLVQQIKQQTLKNIEIVLSIGESPNGHARNVGVDIARGDFLVFIDDDVLLEGNEVFSNLIEPLKNNADIGMTGPAQQIPPSAGRFQHISARQIPRSLSPVVERITDSDMVSHMCLAIARDFFEEIGRESDWLLAGTDPDLRYRVREANRRVVVVPQTWAYHPAPQDLRELLKFSFRSESYV